MKKYLTFLFLLALFFSCSKVDMESIESSYVDVIDKESALKDFAIALSSVCFESKEARALIKKEAEKQFDNDYDVLYVIVKDSKTTGNKTFRELLAEKMKTESMLDEIERVIPGISIYVPDVTWIDDNGFNATTWDISDKNIAVTYKTDTGICKELYHRSCYVGDIQPGTIPGGIVLIVKDNERINNIITTKSGAAEFTFIDDAFDGRLRESTKSIRYTGKYSSSWVQGQPNGDASDYMDVNLLKKYCPEIVEAAELYKDEKFGYQNDYIFYGMTSNNPKGKLRNDLRNRIVRFRIDPGSFNAIFDDAVNTSKKDMNFSDVYDTDDGGDKHKSEPSATDIYSKLWAEGSLEILVHVFVNNGSGQSVSDIRYYYDVKAKDLFTIKNNSIKREQWGSTAVKWYRTWRYSLTQRDESTLASKWYYPGKRVDLPQWDLITNSGYVIRVYEIDSGATIQETISITTKKSIASSGKVTIDNTDSGTICKNEFGWTAGDEESATTNCTITRKEDDDELIQVPINYTNNYATPTANPSTYLVRSFGASRFIFTILPCNYYEM